MAPTPVTIVTGFLGSGKTTLILNLAPQLRASNPDYKLALVKNELGDVAVDSQLASSAAISGVKELLDGCICCNLVGKLDDALQELRAKVSPDRILVETSGSAFPATLVMEINRLVRSTGNYVLDGVISVIDVENWEGYEDTSYTAKVQARYTDLIIFNKWELCDERRFDDCLDMLGALHPEGDMPWVKSNKGWVSMDLVFGIDGGLAKQLTGEGVARKGHDGHEHKHGHQSEVEVLSVELKAENPKSASVNADKLYTFLKNAPKDEVYRIKAVLTASTTMRNSDEDLDIPTPPHNSKNRYILNWAFGRWTFTPLAENFAEHESTSGFSILRMTMMLARYQSTKWKKKLEAGGLVALEGGDNEELVVKKLA